MKGLIRGGRARCVDFRRITVIRASPASYKINYNAARTL